MDLDRVRVCIRGPDLESSFSENPKIVISGIFFGFIKPVHRNSESVTGITLYETDCPFLEESVEVKGQIFPHFLIFSAFQGDVA